MPKEILIVDDEPSIVVPIQFLMEQQGYSVVNAENGHDALDMIYQYTPDLVLLDIMLPGIDGYEVCEIVRLNPKLRDIKIILTSRSFGFKRIISHTSYPSIPGSIISSRTKSGVYL